MDKNRKFEILNAPAVAYYSGWNGIEIKEIEYGIEDYVLFVGNAWYGERWVGRSKIQYDREGNAYFLCKRHRIPLGECIRTSLVNY